MLIHYFVYLYLQLDHLEYYNLHIGTYLKEKTLNGYLALNFNIRLK